MPAELAALTVADATAWASWLAQSAATSKGVWLTLAKKGNTVPTSLTYAQALDEALCHGWIDGQARRGDDRTYSQRFTPRTSKSLWSRRNVDHITRLEEEGRVTALGRAAVDSAKADGRWAAAYAGQATAELPPEFLAAVAAVPEAQATWDTLTRQNRFAIYFRLNALKTQAGRQKRIAAFVEMLARGEAPYPQRERSTAKGPMTVGDDAHTKTTVPKTARRTRRRAPIQEQDTLLARGNVQTLRRSGRLRKATESTA
ncbi:hypothetical protein F5Y17DRAFT_459462 [Xylariaceae sp. FL0594]|nr:hypothetical protein F5Y17DRAFT_459462 [Xylariaceae sp. FL0594]